MKLSVAVCTWNRAELLFQTLERMASSLRVPDGVEWELLIVDNNCTDDTDAVIAAFVDRLPLRRLFQPRQGLANARNLAVREARGDYIVWTDDDVLVDPSWLEEYRSAFRRWPEASFFGGPVEPSLPARRPAWLAEAWPLVRTAYAVLDLGPELVALDHDRLPYGANMAFRLDAQRRFPYDPGLGHDAHGRIGGEETSVMRALLAAGAAGRWVPGARVEHVIPEERLSAEYLRAYYTGRGRRLHLEGQVSRGLPFWVLRMLAAETAYHFGRLTSSPDLWIRGLRASSIARGFLGSRDHPRAAPER
ncbi:MAG TPA: glycosyltransferase [Longimicrobiaceae bacterium]|nr:glycosyltransferase [Longimicrobiaceae bacterium]